MIDSVAPKTKKPPAKKNAPKKPIVHKSKSKYSELEAIPSGLNQNLTSPRASFYKELLGEPRLLKDYSSKPSTANNPALLDICKTDTVGPFRATGLKPAVDSLKEVMDEIAKTYPDLIGRLNNVGMLVVRYIGGTTTLSNHSWGAAIDLYVDGVKDEQRDDKILHGLALIAPIFNKHGWYSGAGYRPKVDNKGNRKSNEDSMHFEVCQAKTLGWAQLGLLGPDAQKFATKKETLKLQGDVKPAKSKEDLTSRVLAGQAIKSANNPLAPEQLPQSNHFTSLLKQRPEETFPSWYGKNGWVTKVRSGFSWFRK